jgi:hypothetical protein
MARCRKRNRFTGFSPVSVIVTVFLLHCACRVVLIHCEVDKQAIPVLVPLFLVVVVIRSKPRDYSRWTIFLLLSWVKICARKNNCSLKEHELLFIYIIMSHNILGCAPTNLA